MPICTQWCAALCAYNTRQYVHNGARHLRFFVPGIMQNILAIIQLDNDLSITFEDFQKSSINVFIERKYLERKHTILCIIFSSFSLNFLSRVGSGPFYKGKNDTIAIKKHSPLTVKKGGMKYRLLGAFRY